MCVCFVCMCVVSVFVEGQNTASVGKNKRNKALQVQEEEKENSRFLLKLDKDSMCV